MPSNEDDPYAQVAKGALKLKNEESVGKKLVFAMIFYLSFLK